jgi:cytoskeleton protein RodZ
MSNEEATPVAEVAEVGVATDSVSAPTKDKVSSAGELLRSLREAQGVELSALASALKVPAHKLEMLEANRFQELPGMAFVRSLTQSMCRQLHVDARPVMALLPSTSMTPDSLETVSRGLAEPFREPATRADPARWPEWLRPTVLGPALLLLAALGFWFAPGRSAVTAADADMGASMPSVTVSATSGVSSAGTSAAASAVGTSSTSIAVPGLVSTASASVAVPVGGGGPLSSVAPAPTVTETVVTETVHLVPNEAPTASNPPPRVAGQVVLRTTAESWVEARDAAGQSLLARMLMPGEVVGLDGAMPVRVKIGNVSGTSLTFRGQAVDLAPFARDNVARVELK